MDKEHKVAILAVIFPFIILGNAFRIVFIQNNEHNVEFTVFDKDVFTDKGKTVTQILTWGDSFYGKYYFIGNWTNQFELDHKYNVTYVKRDPSGHPWNFLIVLEWREIQ